LLNRSFFSSRELVRKRFSFRSFTGHLFSHGFLFGRRLLLNSGLFSSRRFFNSEDLIDTRSLLGSRWLFGGRRFFCRSSLDWSLFGWILGDGLINGFRSLSFGNFYTCSIADWLLCSWL
jgi:hypothetical protein